MTSRQFCCRRSFEVSNGMSKNRQMPTEFTMPSLRLDGSVSLVTGGSRGLGLGMALALAHAGADIAIAARTHQELEEAAEAIQEVGRRSLIVPTDVSDVGAVRAMVRQVVTGFGRLDILVNAAGINIRQPAETFTEA